MARILGVDIPRNKIMEIAIQSLYGVGPSIAKEVLVKAQIDLKKSSNDLTEEEVQRIRKFLEEDYTVEGVRGFFSCVASAMRRRMSTAPSARVARRSGNPPLPRSCLGPLPGGLLPPWDAAGLPAPAQGLTDQIDFSAPALISSTIRSASLCMH